MISFWSIVIGLVIGSFLSVCVYRIPFSRHEQEELLPDGEAAAAPPPPEETDATLAILPDLPAPYDINGKRLSFFYPTRSICPQCKHQLPWWHNLPVLSWILLMGKCGFCKAAIPFRYPLLEILSAFFAWLSVDHFGVTPTAVVIYLFCAALIVITFIDIDYFIIPNTITYPGTALGILLGLINQYTHQFSLPLVVDLTDALLGSVVGGGFLFVIAEGYLRLRGRTGMGLGDVKLLFMTGAFFGLPGAFYTLFIGSIVGCLLGVGMLVVARRGMAHPFPFGPYLALGTVAYVFFGQELIHALQYKMALLVLQWGFA